MKISPITRTTYKPVTLIKPSKDNFKELKNITELSYNPICLAQINFKGIKPNLTSEQKACIKFGLDLYKRLNGADEINLNEDIGRFLNEQGIFGVEIKDISEINSNIRAHGLYKASYRLSDMSYIPGELFLSDIKKSKDKKRNQVSASMVSHELLHAIQHKKVDGDFRKMFIPFNKSATREDDIKFLFSFVNKNIDEIRPRLMAEPLQRCADNMDMLGVDFNEIMQLNIDSMKYFMHFPSQNIEKLNEESFFRMFGGKQEFKAITTSEVVKIMNNLALIKPEFMKSDIINSVLKFLKFRLQNEAEAYRVNSEINKEIKGLDRNMNTCGDLMPMFYNAIMDVIDEIMIKE